METPQNMNRIQSHQSIRRVRKVAPTVFVALAAFVVLVVSAGCSHRNFPDLPGIPDELREIPDVLKGWDLDSANASDFPAISALPPITATESDVLFRGPTLRVLKPGEALEGTDVVFTGMDDGAAIFTVNGLRSPKKLGDSVEYSGEWPGLTGSHFDTRMRISALADDGVHLAGFSQLLIEDVAPVAGVITDTAQPVTFPFVDGVVTGGDTIDGTTYGYLGRYDRGAQFSGMLDSDYPYRRVGDSLEWTGSLRDGVAARYNLRVLRYGNDGARVAGTVQLYLPQVTEEPVVY